MAMSIIGTLKNGGVYEVNGKDGSKKSMISVQIVDEIANSFPCQMWPDDGQFADLSRMIESLRRKRVALTVAGYTVRQRTLKDGSQKIQPNFIMSDVTNPDEQAATAAFVSGTVKGAWLNPIKKKDGSQTQVLSIQIADEVANTYQCQMWPDDPQFAELARSVESLRRRQVQARIASYTTRLRKFKDGTEKPQLSLLISDVQSH